MTYRDNIKAILEANFVGYKEEYIEAVCNRICEIEAIPKVEEIFHVGDEIIVTGNNSWYEGEKGVITRWFDDGDIHYYVLFSDGTYNTYYYAEIEKTDKSYPQILKILEQLKGE
jgi:hypothetical protein